MTIKRFIDFPFLSVYRSLILVIALFSGFAVATPKQDSIKLVTLTARVDSLTQVLRDSKLAAEYAKEGAQATKDGNKAFKDANDNVTEQAKWFIGSVLSVFLAGFGAIGFLIYKRTKDERDYVADQVKKMITPDFDLRLSGSTKKIQSLDGELKTLQANYNGFSQETGRGIQAAHAGLSAYKEAMEVKLKPLLEVHKLEKRIISLEVKAISRTLFEKRKAIESGIESGNLIEALNEVIASLRIVKSNREPYGAFDFLYPDYRDFLFTILSKAECISPESALSLEKSAEFLNPDDVMEVTRVVAVLPPRANQGLRNFLEKTTNHL